MTSRSSTTASRQTTSDSSLIDPAARQQFSLLKWLIEWAFSSKQKLRQAEKVLLAQLKTPYQACFVDIGNVVDVDGSEQIWTLSLTSPQADEWRLPLVLLHGLGMGLGVWFRNLDDLAKQRKVFALDILGFGRSSRPIFSANAELCECQLIAALEEWRRELKISEMILLGHSFGAYLASCYALTYPDRVKYLILSEEWGYQEKEPSMETLWQKSLDQIKSFCHPYSFMRLLGPLANLQQVQLAPSQIVDYAQQCNGGLPSGLAAFYTISQDFQPLLTRLTDLPYNIGITFIHGEQTANNERRSGVKLQQLRSKSHVDIVTLANAGHYVCMDNANIFNQKVCEICNAIDKSLKKIWENS